LNYEINEWTRKLTHYGGKKKYAHNHHYALSDQEHTTDLRGTGICTDCFDISDPPDDAEDVVLLKLISEEFLAKPKVMMIRWFRMGLSCKWWRGAYTDRGLFCF
jgi:hypothetical protein